MIRTSLAFGFDETTFTATLFNPPPDVIVVVPVPAEALPCVSTPHGLRIDVVGTTEAPRVPRQCAANVALVAEVFEDRVRGIGLRVDDQRVGEAPQAGLKDALLFVSDRVPGYEPSAEEQQAHNLHVVRERDLCDRFGLVPA